jgi:putative transposase
MRHGQGGRGAFPPTEQVTVLSVATSQPADYHCPATRWSLDDMVAALHQQARPWTMSRSTLGRILEEADRKPHRSVYWRNRHAPAFEAKARDICLLYVNALRF